MFQTKRPQPTLHALTVEKEVSFEADEFGFGESDDEVGDEESQKGAGTHVCFNSLNIHFTGRW